MFRRESLGSSSDVLKWLDTSKVGLNLAPVGQGSVLGQILDVDSIKDEVTAGTHALVVGTIPLGESPLLADVNLLSARELELGTTEGLNAVFLVLVVASDGNQDLSNAYSGTGSVSLTESTSHSSLEPISSST